MDKVNFYLQCAIILTAFGYGQSLECYTCSSDNDTDCSEIFDKEHTKLKPVTCDIYEARYCIKTTGVYEGTIGVRRFCSSRKFEDYCSYVERKGDKKAVRSCVYSCSSDGCNGGDTNLPYISLQLIAISLSILITIDGYLSPE